MYSSLHYFNVLHFTIITITKIKHLFCTYYLSGIAVIILLELYCVSFMQPYKLDPVIISIVVVRKLRFREVQGFAKFMTDQWRRPEALCLHNSFVNSVLQVACDLVAGWEEIVPLADFELLHGGSVYSSCISVF